MSALLTLDAVTAGYAGKPIVQEIGFSIDAGEFCVLLGLNGSGKTTLLRAVCGLLPMQSGRCFVAGRDCTRLPEHKRARHISYIPQRHSKMQGVTVLDAVMMGYNPHLGLLESPTRAQRERAQHCLAQMGLADLAHHDFARLSEGQKQLVILTRTLVQDAPVMLMDEPDSALDFLNRHQMLAKIRTLMHAGGKAGLITLHDPNFALAYCDRLILLQQGRIVGELRLAGATPEQIRRCLSTLYGPITILEHRGRFTMLQGSDPPHR